MQSLMPYMRKMGLAPKRSEPGILTRVIEGAIGGLVGTLTLQFLDSLSRRWAPSTVPAEGDAGRFMVNQAERALPEETRQRVPESAENAVASSLGFGYGMTFGIVYGLIRPRGGSVMLEGAALGLGCWAVGYLGWLPAAGLMDPVWRQNPAEVIGPAARHALYGVATVATFEAIREHM